MPRIQWTNLPPALRDHLFDRLRDRKITVDDLYQLKIWREAEPEAPEGAWFKDFGSFKICGEGNTRRRFSFAASQPKARSCDGGRSSFTQADTPARGGTRPELETPFELSRRFDRALLKLDYDV